MNLPDWTVPQMGSPIAGWNSITKLGQSSAVQVTESGRRISLVVLWFTGNSWETSADIDTAFLRALVWSDEAVRDLKEKWSYIVQVGLAKICKVYKDYKLVVWDIAKWATTQWLFATWEYNRSQELFTITFEYEKDDQGE
jgi:hypothetical protein